MKKGLRPLFLCLSTAYLSLIAPARFIPLSLVMPFYSVAKSDQTHNTLLH